MRMGLGLIFGSLLLLAGVGIIVKVVFNLDIPVFKIFFALLLVAVGIQMLVGFKWHKTFACSNPREVIFSEATFDASHGVNEANVVFSSAVYDFSMLTTENLPRRLELNTVFGSSLIKINKNTPVQIKADGAFAGIILPNGNTSSFGNALYQSPDYSPETGLTIKLSTVFAETRVVFVE